MPARPMAPSPWNGEGFTLTTEGSAVADFYDEDEVQRVYSPEVERLVKQASGAAEVLVFDHTIRVADDTLRSERKVREPVHVAHNDYTNRSAPQRVRDLLPADRGGGAIGAPLCRGADLAADRGPGAGPPTRHLRCPKHR